MEDVVAKSITQAGTVIHGNVTIAQGAGSPLAEPEYCGVCFRVLTEDHFRCPECGEEACLTCRSEGSTCKNCAVESDSHTPTSSCAASADEPNAKPSLTVTGFNTQAETLLKEKGWATFFPDDFEDAYMERFKAEWDDEVAKRSLKGHGNAHMVLLIRLGNLARATNSFPLSKSGNRRPPRRRPWGEWGWDEIDEYVVSSASGSNPTVPLTSERAQTDASLSTAFLADKEPASPDSGQIEEKADTAPNAASQSSASQYRPAKSARLDHPYAENHGSGNTGQVKNKWVAALLAFFLGAFGAHKFYLGNKRHGLIYLGLFWTVLPMYISWVESVIYVFTSQEKFAEKYRK